MKSYRYHSLPDYINKTDLENVSAETLFIFDIDGVFFRGVLDPRQIIGVIHDENKKAFESILATQAPCWIMTNRPNVFRHFPYIKQLSSSIEKITSASAGMYSNCSDFLNDRSKMYNIIMNAQKPSEESKAVVKKGMEQFRQVIYIGGRDMPFYFTDAKLVEELAKEVSSDNLTFIEID